MYAYETGHIQELWAFGVAHKLAVIIIISPYVAISFDFPFFIISSFYQTRLPNGQDISIQAFKKRCRAAVDVGKAGLKFHTFLKNLMGH